LKFVKFSIIQYSQNLEIELSKLDRQSRLVFSLWFCRDLWKQFSGSLPAVIGADRTKTLASLVEADFWGAGEPADACLEIAGMARNALAEIAQPEFAIDTGDEFANFGVAELLGCIDHVLAVIATGSAEAAAQCAEHVINRVDYELAFFSDERDPTSHPKFQQELDRQKRMLGRLADRNNPLTPDEIRQGHF
jgi:hypothetical protein